jgi:hypothetical protein
MNGSQVEPPVISGAVGLTLASLNNASSRLTISATFGPFASIPVSAHIHGPANVLQNAPVIFDLGPIRTVRLGSVWIGVIDSRQMNLTAGQIQQLLGRQWYVDVHTQSHPNGEIRGVMIKISGNPSARFTGTIYQDQAEEFLPPGLLPERVYAQMRQGLFSLGRRSSDGQLFDGNWLTDPS